MKQKNNSLYMFLFFLLLINYNCYLIFDEGQVSLGELPSHDLDTPVSTLKLHPDLDEISGLTYHPVKNQLVSVNDERGVIFFIDPESGETLNRIVFSKSGDYEGVEIVNDMIYIVRSDGDLFPYGIDMGDLEKIENELSSSNDIEGLGYDAENNSLLLACKAKPFLKDEEEIEHARAIYSFSLADNKLNKDPFLIVEENRLKMFLEAEFTEDPDLNFEPLERRLSAFAPSGIAIHPKSKEIYILSDQGKVLLVFSKMKELSFIHFLDRKLHTKPEGICFSPSGQLYISNEGKGRRGRIYSYQ